MSAGAGGSITESNGAVVTISDSGEIEVGGQPVLGGEGSKAVTYVNGVIWGQDASSGGWFQWTGNMWEGPSGDPTAGVASTCPPTQTNGGGNGGSGANGPTVLTAGDSGTIIENDGTRLTITADGRIQQNGTDIPGGSGSKAVTYVGGVVWGQDANSGGWYQFVNGMWQGPSSTSPVTAASGSDSGTGAGNTGAGTIRLANSTLRMVGSSILRAPFLVEGVNTYNDVFLLDALAQNAAGQPLTTIFPKLNYVRVMVFPTYHGPDAWDVSARH